ncbi:hypothetical protein SANTM175S_01562 [Streptomyces antimycoticus]
MAVITNADADDPETLDILAEATVRLARRNESPEIRSERAALLGERSDIVRSIEQLYSDLRMGIYDGQIGRQQFLADKSSLETRLRAVDARIVVVGDSDLPPLPIEEWTDSEDGPRP